MLSWNNAHRVGVLGMLLIAVAVQGAPSSDPPREMLQVNPDARTSHATPPVSNGLIAYARNDATGQLQIFTINPDGTGEQQLTTLGHNQYPAWSFDGQSMVFSSNRTGAHELWTMDADGGNKTQITFNTAGGNFTPEFSPDQSKIIFASVRGGLSHPEVWVMDANGANQTRLTTTPVFPGLPNWSLHANYSPDGTKIVFASTMSGTSQIWMMDADGTNQQQVTIDNGPGAPDSNAPDWSRDGTKITFWSGFETQFGEVWVMDADGANKTQLTTTTDPRNSDNPEWSPDGTTILFDSNRAGPVEVWSIDDTGANPSVLVPATGGQVSWQPIVTLAADLNADGAVDLADLASLLANWGSTSDKNDRADLNADGVIELADLAQFLANWAP